MEYNINSGHSISYSVNSSPDDPHEKGDAFLVTRKSQCQGRSSMGRKRMRNLPTWYGTDEWKWRAPSWTLCCQESSYRRDILPNKTCNKASWVSPAGNVQNQIVHIAISQRGGSSLQNERMKRGMDASLDHHDHQDSKLTLVRRKSYLPFLGNHYFIHSLSEPCSEVEKNIFFMKNINFTLLPKNYLFLGWGVIKFTISCLLTLQMLHTKDYHCPCNFLEDARRRTPSHSNRLPEWPKKKWKWKEEI